MKTHIVIAGGRGLIGSACRELLSEQGYNVYILTRSKETRPGEVSWDPEKQRIEKNVIDGATAVINLCGRSLAEKRWTPRYKKLLQSSRIVPAQYLHILMSQAVTPPICYIGASGIGIYGDQGTHPIFDDSGITANGFVAELVKSWEQAHHEMGQIRNVILRIGVVISAQGGFLDKLITSMRFGIYPYFGRGTQLLSWIYIDDLTHMILHCIRTSTISGIYHATSPASIAQRELMRTLKDVSDRRGIIFSVPSALLKLRFGEMASILFESADVRPDKIVRTGFQLAFPDMRSALREALRQKVT